jgi:spermidine synthase
VVDASRAHLPTVHAGAFDDPRAELVIEDGFGFVRRTAKRFDVIIVDSTDPRGAAWRLFTTAFYSHCRERLSEGGILVAQAGVPFMQPDELTMVTDRLGHVFRDVSAYTATVPTYYGGSIAFAWGCDDHARRTTEQETLARRFADAAIATRYYAADVHLAAFVLPRFMRELIQPHP